MEKVGGSVLVLVVVKKSGVLAFRWEPLLHQVAVRQVRKDLLAEILPVLGLWALAVPAMVNPMVMALISL